MLYNDDFLLLHYPKTAGKSVSVYFCRNFAKPIYGNVSKGQVIEIGMGPEDGVHLQASGGHDNFMAAAGVLADRGIDIYSFKALILPVRNPYDLVVSNYFFLRQSYEANSAMRERKPFALAAQNTFAEFCAKSPMGNFQNFLPRPNALRRLPVELIHFETLGASLAGLLGKYGIEETYPLPHLNPSKRNIPLAEMYDEASKRNVDEKMDTMFQIGQYEKTLPTECHMKQGA